MSCQNHYCHITGRRSGQCTNSDCVCLRSLPLADQLALKKRIAAIEAENDKLMRRVDGLENDNAVLRFICEKLTAKAAKGEQE